MSVSSTLIRNYIMKCKKTGYFNELLRLFFYNILLYQGCTESGRQDMRDAWKGVTTPLSQCFPLVNFFPYTEGFPYFTSKLENNAHSLKIIRYNLEQYDQSKFFVFPQTIPVCHLPSPKAAFLMASYCPYFLSNLQQL